ncbi:hypothetical protein BJ322DRAFT_1038566 [Thelephora terrestris]|uniref:HD/PDEase domain-containing protein n=1 Tax=Thelephora terrestris TaxID=56493 RepID=A0A9P6LAI0_9AGAM|nr:hypothetical protein BJ322DRAFT_1038566 [Thelephora terrestris]
MYPTPDEAAVLKNIEAFMVKTMARYDPSHDALHVQRVRGTALKLASNPSISSLSPDLLVIELSALLHDVLDKKYVPESLSSDPLAFFHPLFQELDDQHPSVGLLAEDGRRARLIADIVTNVSWTTEKKLRQEGKWGAWHESCLELHCVQDADRLDAIGAFGIMRCSAYTAVTSNPLHVPNGDPLQASSAIQHFYDKLLHIKDHLKTEPGKRMGQKRHEIMLQFLKAVEDEYEGEQ